MTSWQQFIGIGGMKATRERLTDVPSDDQAERERKTVEAARLLNEVIHHAGWPVVQAIFTDAFDETFEAVMEGSVHKDALAAIRGLYRKFDATVTIGTRLMERAVERDRRNQTAVESARDAGGYPFRVPSSPTRPAAPSRDSLAGKESRHA